MTIRKSVGGRASLLVAGGCLLAVAGCSSPSATTTSAAPASIPGAAVSTRGPIPARSSASCSDLAPTDVQFLLADPAIGPTVTAIGTDADGQRCDFNNADEDETVEVDVFPTTDPTFGYAAQEQDVTGAVEVGGVGDHAFRENDDYLPTAEAAGITCSVSASVDEIPAASSLIVGGHSITLTAAQQDLVASALGTVCNRIFGAGPTSPDLSRLHG